ncbi:MAG TPA: DUF5916 domain-containing protein [Acidobacteriota bacterium]|nr:DUF5916 domain-containing protein [Acidobacteriota bacterium]
MNPTTPLLGTAGLRALTVAAVAVTLGSPAVIAQQPGDDQEPRRRQIPVRLVVPVESARPVRQGRRHIPVRLIRPGETDSPISTVPAGAERAVPPSTGTTPPALTDDLPPAPSADISGASTTFADRPIDGKRTAATRTSTPPVLDGRIDDAVWELADVVSDFVQKDPVNRVAPTKRTEARVLYDDDTLYVGWINFDDEPDKIVANDMRRDATMTGEDYAAVFFDTFRDRRNAFGFQVNALGAKFDYTLTDESQLNMNWDETWEAAASITERGWEAELAIPFAALRYPTGSNVWGVEFERDVARTKERINWNNTSRDYNWLAVSQYGNLVGLQDLTLTDRFRLKPFVTGGYDSFQQRDDPFSEGRGDIGLERFQVQLTPSLTANLTVNTDFAEVEADNQQVNLTRFSLFFPEQREFFLEAADNFTFGTLARRSAGGGEGGGFRRQPPLALLFFSRRIGLGPEGQPVPIRFGGKLTGKIGSGNVGFVNVQTSDSQFGAGQNFAAFRWKQSVLDRSSVGALVTNVQGPDGQYNRVLGFDSSFILFDHLFLSGFVAGAQDNDVDGTSWVGQLSAGWDTEAWGLGGDVTYVADDFDTDLGFVLRQDIVRTSYQGRWSTRPSWPLLRRVSISPSLERITDTSGRLVTRVGSLTTRMDLESGDIFNIRLNRNYERLDFDFPIDENVSIPIGDYSWTDGQISLRAAPRRAVSGNLTFNLGEFYDGTRFGIGGGPSFKFSDRFNLSPQYNFNRIHLPGGSFDTHLARLRANLSFSDRVLFDSLLQHSSITDQLSAFVRLRYIYRTGDDFYLVYRQSTAFGGLFDRRDDRTLTAKFTFTMQR